MVKRNDRFLFYDLFDLLDENVIKTHGKLTFYTNNNKIIDKMSS